MGNVDLPQVHHFLFLDSVISLERSQRVIFERSLEVVWSDCYLFSLSSDQRISSLSWTSAFINKHACVANKIVSLLIVCKYIMVMLIHHDHRTLRIAIRTHVTYAKEACHCSLSKEETEGKSELLGSGIAEVQLQLHKGKPDQHLSLHCMNDIPKVFNGSVEKRNSNECEVRYLQCKTIFVQRCKQYSTFLYEPFKSV